MPEPIEGARGSLVHSLVAIGACATASAVAFCAFPVAVGVHDSYLVAGVFRALWAGLVGGLATRWLRRSRAVVATAAGAVAAGFALEFGLRVIPLWGVFAAGALAALVAWLSRAAVERGWERTVVALAMVAVFAGFAWQIGIVGGPFAKTTQELLANASHEPVAETYHFDGPIFVKTMYLVKRGVPYYQAFSQAYVGHEMFSAPPPVVFNYREPWPARLVAILPGNPGVDAWLVLLVLVVVALLSAYALGATFAPTGVALLGPMLLAAYYAFPLTTKWFSFSEVWAGALAMAAVALFARERWLPAVLTVTAAVSFRELMVYLIPVGVAAWVFYPRRRQVIPQLVALVVLPVAALAYHVLSAPAPLRIGGSSDLAFWMHSGLVSLVASLRFSAKYVAWGAFSVPVAPVFALAAAALVTGLWRKALLVSAVLVPTIALTLFSNGVYGYYWGAVAAPVILAIAPLCLAVFLASEGDEGDRTLGYDDVPVVAPDLTKQAPEGS